MDRIDEALLARPDYRLADNLDARRGSVFLSGTQALVRLPLMQRALDREAGHSTAGFISGYRGSPLGGFDQQLWRVRERLDAQQVRFLPAVNEELAAAAVLGSQRAGADPERSVDGVFAMWYGKGPGVDRASDALRHGHVFGSSSLGGVLAVIGDDHGCVSSSMPHQSDPTLRAWRMPVLNPSNVAEMIEFGLYGWALSRFSGGWVALKAISETVESAGTVDLDRLRTHFAPPSDHVFPAGGVHCRLNDPPSLALETRLAAKLDAVRAFARANPIDRVLCAAEHADIGIVTCGKAHLDVLEVLRRLEISLDDLERAGVRVYKVGQSFPLAAERMLDVVHGLREVFVIEEKASFVEQQLQELLFNRRDFAVPLVIGKLDAAGQPLLSALGELRPSRIMNPLAHWLARHKPALDRRTRTPLYTLPVLPSNAADVLKRTPYFCPGCPHNSSTCVPTGSRAQAGIGCHVMASWMDRDTTGQIQMGSEGVDWVAHSMFTRTPHVFQNLGDGTYFHSGFLAIRQAVAAGTRMTYKVLYNNAVAMTGGQPVDGQATVESIARQVQAEGVQRVAVVSDEPAVHVARRAQFPQGTSFHHRRELDAVQRELRELPGVTVLIYDQTCAAEKRRRIKKGERAPSTRFSFIHEAVCEGCGDCAVASNCLAIVPLETPAGRKRAIDQSACNHDFACLAATCPAIVTVEGARLRRPQPDAALADKLARAALPEPVLKPWAGPYDLLVAGVGGSGVVTVGALITMAAHLEGKVASVLDFTGFAQKGGPVLSHVRLACTPAALNQARIDTQQADALLACDLVVGASAEALQSVGRGRTAIVANTHATPTGDFLRNPDAQFHVPALLDKLRATGARALDTLDAQDLAQRVLGDTLASNIVALGYAWQRGLVPVSMQALQRAIELNGVAVEMNRSALRLGRLAAADPTALAAPALREETLDELIARHAAHLTAYQDAALSARYLALVQRVQSVESALRSHGEPLALTRAVATSLVRLLAPKDEYEVARLYTDPAFRTALEAQFEGAYRLQLHVGGVPGLRAGRSDGRLRKLSLDARWAMPLLKLLAGARRLRGSALDLFGRSAQRRDDRRRAADFVRQLEALLPGLQRDRLDAVTAWAAQPAAVRGFGSVRNASAAKLASQTDELLRRATAATPA